MVIVYESIIGIINPSQAEQRHGINVSKTQNITVCDVVTCKSQVVTTVVR